MKLNVTRREALDICLACTAAQQLAGDGGRKWSKLHDRIKQQIDEYDREPVVISIHAAVHLKHYNSDRYWILPEYYTRDYEYEDVTVPEALKQLRNDLDADMGVKISKNALRPSNIEPFWYSNSDDPAGVIITGSMIFSDYQYRMKPDTKQYVDVICTISRNKDTGIDLAACFGY